MYGPLVLAGERGTEDMQAPAPFSNPALYNDYYTYNFHVPADLRTSLKVDMKHPERTLQRTGKELKFTTEQGDVIRPLYDLQDVYKRQSQISATCGFESPVHFNRIFKRVTGMTPTFYREQME